MLKWVIRPMVRMHHRDNEISESESGSDGDDDPSGRADRLAGLKAYKKDPKAGGTRGAAPH